MSKELSTRTGDDAAGFLLLCCWSRCGCGDDTWSGDLIHVGSSCGCRHEDQGHVQPQAPEPEFELPDDLNLDGEEEQVCGRIVTPQPSTLSMPHQIYLRTLPPTASS